MAFHARQSGHKIRSAASCAPPHVPLVPYRAPSVFQEARAQIEGEIGRIVSCLNIKKVEMFEEIDRLEREFENKQQQQQKELNKLKSLKSQTEELGENNLLAIQHKLVGELELEIDALTLTRKLMPDYNISVVWGFSNRDLMRSINSSYVETVGEIFVSHMPEPTCTPLYITEDYSSR